MIDFRRMRFLINRLPMALFRVERAMSKATRVSAVISDMPHGSSTECSVARGAEALMLAKDAYARMKRELADMRAELNPMIETLEKPLEKTVMRLRYMDGQSVRSIAIGLSYSEQHIFRVLQDAEKRLTGE